MSKLAKLPTGMPGRPWPVQLPGVVLVWEDIVQENKSTLGLEAHTLVPGEGKNIPEEEVQGMR